MVRNGQFNILIFFNNAISNYSNFRKIPNCIHTCLCRIIATDIKITVPTTPNSVLPFLHYTEVFCCIRIQ